MSAGVTVTGATGLLGPRLVAALQARGHEVTVLTRDPEHARRRLGDVRAMSWDLLAEPAPAAALAGREAVVNLAGAPVAQRWSAAARRAIRETRTTGTRNLLAGLEGLKERPRTLVSSSATGYYGARGEEPLDEDASPGEDFLARVCVEWEAEAERGRGLGMRVVTVRTGVVLDASGGALGRMLAPFRLGLGGPVAGGRQYVSWIHADDLIALMCTALESEQWSGPVNATAPEPVTNAEFSRALGRALGRPAVEPVPGFALRLLYGEMATIITSGARVVPARPLVLGYEFEHPRVQEALSAAVAE
jgi:uncharacterized protein (TIGR01777 family)